MMFMEDAGMDQEDLMSLLSAFKAVPAQPASRRSGRVLLAVVGGRLSEGIDFPDETLEVVVVAGIPFPKPTARTKSLVEFFETKFGRGWEYAIEVPTSRRLLQAIGRAIRGPEDVGAAAILDYRAGQFADRIEGLRRADAPSEAIVAHLVARRGETAAPPPAGMTSRRPPFEASGE
jgi:DNA excision repair protein ERCC-2